MGKDSKIEWTHHTFNPWWGCVKASAGCVNCYAEGLAKRFGEQVWGTNAPRRFFGDKHWNEPLRWHAKAQKSRQRERVFCASMADVFEDRRDLDSWRTQLWKLIEHTPCLDWLLVTKRPEKVAKLVPWKNNWPENIWLGTTVESQELAKQRITPILEIPATVRFVSCEPLLGPLDLTAWLGAGKVDWVIVGGESAASARPMQPTWVEDIQQQCLHTNSHFFFKQWGTFGVDGVRRTKKNNGKMLQGREIQELPMLKMFHQKREQSYA